MRAAGQNFTQYGSSALFAYPNTANPTLLFWSTANPIPAGGFSIPEAWTQPANSGCFVFVSNPAENLQDLAAISQAMAALPGGPPYGCHTKPAPNSRGFIWLDLDRQTASVLSAAGEAAAMVSSDITLGYDSGIPALALKAGAPILPQPGGESFTFLYPAGIPRTDPPPVQPAYPITLNLLGPTAGQFQFTGFMPQYGYCYQYSIIVDPLNATNCTQTLIPFAIELVPTGLPFPAYAIQIPPQG
ncbi:MAG: hypothetical protein RIB41_12225 [Oceanibaculum nanhaiense]|jgi:hypothetical protein|uniref:hypothetical protein n=1 Tax=Oceanibaculum nanhaiense TaxID=1909734 RepID=UPI0032EAA406